MKTLSRLAYICGSHRALFIILSRDRAEDKSHVKHQEKKYRKLQRTRSGVRMPAPDQDSLSGATQHAIQPEPGVEEERCFGGEED